MAKKKELGKVTYITLLSPENNKEIIEAFELEKEKFNTAKIRTFHHIRKLEMAGKSFDMDQRKEWIKVLQNDFDILKRTANSIIYEANTIWSMRKETETARLKSMKEKQKTLVNEIKKMEKAKQKNIGILTGKTKICRKSKESNEEYFKRKQEVINQVLKKQKALRALLVAKKKKKNRNDDQITKLEKDVKTRNFRICFGTKKLQKKNTDLFRSRKNSQMSFIGSSDETCQNQIFHLYWTKSRNQFDIKMRKDFYKKPTKVHKGIKGKVREREEDAYAFGRVYFNHGAIQIREALKKRNSALSYRIIKKEDRYYLYCTLDLTKSSHKTPSSNIRKEIQQDGIVIDSLNKTKNKNPYAIGVDVNKGFLAVSVINSCGGLIDTFRIDCPFGCGNRSKTGMRYAASRLTWLAKQLNVPVVIEDINLTKKKQTVQKGKNKKYNQMLHSFAYKRFNCFMAEASFKNEVSLIKTNPAWTSVTARRKYCLPMNLCVHNGAAYVIARKGAKFKDDLPTVLTKQQKVSYYSRNRLNVDELSF